MGIVPAEDEMNELAIFNYEQKEARTVQIDGEPWFVAKDVCDALSLSDVSMSLRGLDEDEKDTSSVCTPGGNQQLSIVNEPGLYSLILRSRKPEAKAFKRWITHEVLPTIRKTGGAYLTASKAEELLANPDLIISLAQQVKELRSTNERQQQQIEADRPKTIFADAVSASHTSILIGELAKLLKQNGIEIGQNRLFDWLRDNGYLIRRKGADWNMPTQRSMELGLFEIKERTLNEPSGSVRITKTVKCTGKGQVYFVTKFIEERDSRQAA